MDIIFTIWSDEPPILKFRANAFWSCPRKNEAVIIDGVEYYVNKVRHVYPAGQEGYINIILGAA